jgi:hypothetical protein
MSRLFVANTSKLHHDFTYKLPHENTFRMETIRAGSQIRLSLDMSLDVIAEIIHQHEPYGMKDANRLSNIKEYVGQCYNIDKPVPLDNLLYLFETNGPKLNERAKEEREEVAAATAAIIENKMQQLNIAVTSTEVTLEEDTRGTQSINEGYEMPQPGMAPKHGGARSRRAARVS